MGPLSQDWGSFMLLLILNMFPIPLDCSSSASLMHMIHKFGVLMESQSSCIHIY
jgi:hypothetical protein